MSYHPFRPFQDEETEHLYVSWNGGFTDEEIEKIVKIGEDNLPEKAKINAGEEVIEYDSIRRSKTSWISENEETSWLYQRLGWIAQKLNSQYYKFELTGFFEDLQFTVYESDEQGHYNWHLDRGNNTPSPRKLSMVLQLSDPVEYEGGDLELCGGSTNVPVLKQKGFIVCFPSFALHRVTPVTAGVRRSLVVWFGGPPFK